MAAAMHQHAPVQGVYGTALRTEVPESRARTKQLLDHQPLSVVAWGDRLYAFSFVSSGVHFLGVCILISAAVVFLQLQLVIKYDQLLGSNNIAQWQQPLQAWQAFAIGWTLCLFDEVWTFLLNSAMHLVFAEGHPARVAIAQALPYRTERELIRQFGAVAGSLLLVIGSWIIFRDHPLGASPAASSTSTPPSAELMLQYTTWLNDRYASEASSVGVILLLVGAGVRLAALILDAIIDRGGLNFLYILPVWRGAFTEETPPVDVYATSHSHSLNDNYGHHDHLAAFDYESVPCQLPFTASLWHNWLAAFRLHSWPSSVFLVTGLVFLLSPFKQDAAFYVPWESSNSTSASSIYHPSYGLRTHATDESESNAFTDTGYSIYVGSILLLVSALLQLFSQTATFISVARKEAAKARNHWFPPDGYVGVYGLFP